jgi:hypothetical protein
LGATTAGSLELGFVGASWPRATDALKLKANHITRTLVLNGNKFNIPLLVKTGEHGCSSDAGRGVAHSFFAVLKRNPDFAAWTFSDDEDYENILPSRWD